MVTRTQGPLVSVIASASLAAGLVHAAAAGTHADERQAAIVFAAIALFQIAWAAWVWTKPSRLALAAGVVVNLACIATWCLAKVSGVPFIDGLGHTEKLQFADAWASGVELLIVLGAAWMLTAGRTESEERVAPRALSWGIAGVLVIGTGPAMVAPHAHAHSSESSAHEHTSGVEAADTSTEEHAHDHASSDASDGGATSDASKALGAVHSHLSPDGKMPTEKPTKAEQARADQLVSETETALAPFANATVETSVENGRFIRIPGSTEIFRSIRDTSGAFEHFVNWDRLDDGKVVDPSAIESVVVRTKGGVSKVVAAMYVLPSGTLGGNEPAVGGPLTMWHVHDNLCFNADREVAGTWSKATGCPTGSTHWITAPMLHVWSEDTPCGRFAELDGPAIAGGTCGTMDMGSHAHSAGATAADSTPAQLKQERKLIAETKAAIEKYASTDAAVSAGYVSIGDSMTGFEHFVKGEYLQDEYTLDPAHIESLVYQVNGDGKTLISGMYILENGSMMSDVPDFGGPRVMWHNHIDLCWGAPGKLGGVLRNGRCRPGGTLGVTSPMLHVWVVPNECGPFAGIEAKEVTGCGHEAPRITGVLSPTLE